MFSSVITDIYDLAATRTRHAPPFALCAPLRADSRNTTCFFRIILDLDHNKSVWRPVCYSLRRMRSERLTAFRICLKVLTVCCVLKSEKAENSDRFFSEVALNINSLAYVPAMP